MEETGPRGQLEGGFMSVWRWLTAGLAALVAALNTVVASAAVSVSMSDQEMGEAGYFNPTQSTSVSFEGVHGQNVPTIVDTYVQIFASNVWHVSQQRGSRLMGFVIMEGMTRDAKQVDRIGTFDAPQPYISRGSKVTASNPEQDTRWITAQRYWLAAFIDKYDQGRVLYDISSLYMQGMAMSFGRLYDRVIIAAALGDVWVGPTRQRVSLPAKQKFAAYNSSATAEGKGEGFNLDTLEIIRLKLKKSFAIEAGQTVVVVVTAEEIHSLLQEDKVTNRDYTNVLALVGGELSSFYGMIFVETQLIPYTESDTYYVQKSTLGANTASNRFPEGRIITSAERAAIIADSVTDATYVGTVPSGRGLRCFAMAPDAICFGLNQNVTSNASPRPDLHYNMQLYYSAEFGAMRKEEIKVVEIVTLDKHFNIV